MNDTDHRSEQDHDASVVERPDRSNDVGRADEESDQPRESGGRKGPDPVRYGDWEKNGRCIDF